MKPSDLRLTLVRIVDVRGNAFGQDPDLDEAQLRAVFSSKVSTSLDNIKVGETIELHLRFEAFIDDLETSDFEIEVAGKLVVLDEHVIAELRSDAGVYQAATLLFPFIRSYSKPLLEALGTGDIEFPYFLPPPPEARKAKPSARKPKSKAAE